MAFDISLEFAVCLTHARLLSDGEILGSVIADDTSPESIIKIERKNLLVFSVNRLDDTGHAV